MHFHIVTLLPPLVEAVLEHGVISRAYRAGHFTSQCWNPRDYSADRRIDDKPYGGGAGMVMQYAPLASLFANLPTPRHTIYTAPEGALLSTAHLSRWQSLAAKNIPLVLLCGRYEGIDERFITRYVDERVRTADVVISGGELAAMTIVDSLVRHIPGALGDDDSARYDSFSDAFDGLLDSPPYTTPHTIEGAEVPEVLRSGNHARIAEYRAFQRLARTAQFHPERLTPEHRATLDRLRTKWRDA